MENCDKCEHLKGGCDEDCRGCPDCYVKTGDTICDKICEHTKHTCDTRSLDEFLEDPFMDGH